MVPLPLDPRQLCGQILPQGGQISLHGLPSHVHDAHLGQTGRAVSLGHLDEGILPLHRLLVALQRGRGRGQQHESALGGTAVAGNVTGVVLGILIGFIGMLLLLVHDDHTQIGHGREDSRAGAHHDGSLPHKDAAVGVQPLPRGQPRVNDRHPMAVAVVEDAQHLRGQADLGKQDNGSLPPIQHAVDHFQNHAGLAASRHAVKQGGLGLTRQGKAIQRGHRLGLLLAEGEGGADTRPRVGCGKSRDLPYLHGQKALVHKGFQLNRPRSCALLDLCRRQSLLGGEHDLQGSLLQLRGHTDSSLIPSQRRLQLGERAGGVVVGLGGHIGLAYLQHPLDQPFVAKPCQRRGGLRAKSGLNGLGRHRPPRAHVFQHHEIRGGKPGAALLHADGIVLCHGVVLHQRGQRRGGHHGANRLTQGAQGGFLQVKAQAQLTLGEEQLFAAYAVNGLDPVGGQVTGQLGGIPHRDHHAQLLAVAPSEGHRHERPPYHPVRHVGGDKIMENTVNGERVIQYMHAAIARYGFRFHGGASLV